MLHLLIYWMCTDVLMYCVYWCIECVLMYWCISVLYVLHALMHVLLYCMYYVLHMLMYYMYWGIAYIACIDILNVLMHCIYWCVNRAHSGYSNRACKHLVHSLKTFNLLFHVSCANRIGKYLSDHWPAKRKNLLIIYVLK